MSLTSSARLFLVTLLLLALGERAAAAGIEDFTLWSLVEDPPHAGMSANIDSPAQITLTANGPVPAGVDIGYQSVDAATVASSTAGFYFSPHTDFSLAIDFDTSNTAALGVTAIGLGIGEDSDGANSAGTVLTFLNGAPFVAAGAGRTNDVSTLAPLVGAAPASGRLFVSYQAASGDVSFGISAVAGSNTPTASGTFAGIQNGWTDADLLVSLFLRSDDPFPFNALTAGTFAAGFTSLDVLAGSPSAVPLPGAVWLLGVGLLAMRPGRRSRCPHRA